MSFWLVTVNVWTGLNIQHNNTDIINHWVVEKYVPVKFIYLITNILQCWTLAHSRDATQNMEFNKSRLGATEANVWTLGNDEYLLFYIYFQHTVNNLNIVKHMLLINIMLLSCNTFLLYLCLENFRNLQTHTTLVLTWQSVFKRTV